MAAIVLAQGIEIVLGRLMLAANLNVARAVRITIGTIVCVLLTVVLTPVFGIECYDRRVGVFRICWSICCIPAACSVRCDEGSYAPA